MLGDRGSRGALGNKSRSFCEAVNCERSEQEGKFLFAMLMVSIWGYNCMAHSGKVKTRIPLWKARRVVVPFYDPL